MIIIPFDIDHLHWLSPIMKIFDLENLKCRFRPYFLGQGILGSG
jgi:hypothetical protein